VLADLPRLVVPRVQDTGLSADPTSGFWPEVAPAPLFDVVTARPPAQATELRVAVTAQDLRVLFCAIDADPWATLTERDAPLYTEEVVEVFLDPIGDLAGYFEIELNPLGAVLDLLIRRNARGLLKDRRWQCEGLRTKVLRTPTGWNAELAIPWPGLSQSPPTPGAQWRANFTRIDRPRGVPRELTAWSPTGRALFHVPEQFGVLEF
jgi:hypothetical protein